MKINTKKDYNNFKKYLKTLSDEKYLKFNSSLIFSNKKMYGIRIPILKNISKELVDDYKNFIKYNDHESFEECMIHGLIIGYLKKDFEEILKLIDDFIIYNDNWAINDSVCANLKCFRKNKEMGFIKINEYINSNNPWKIRFALILLLDYYIEDKYINQILNICKRINSDEYYVKMAVSWLISVCYIKYPKETYKLLKEQKLDKFTQNKSISKIRDSYRVSKKDKDKINKLKY